MPDLFHSDIYLCNEIQGSFLFFSPMCFTQYSLCDTEIHHAAGPGVPIRLYVPTMLELCDGGKTAVRKKIYMWPEEVNFNFFPIFL